MAGHLVADGMRGLVGGGGLEGGHGLMAAVLAMETAPIKAADVGVWIDGAAGFSVEGDGMGLGLKAGDRGKERS